MGREEEQDGAVERRGLPFEGVAPGRTFRQEEERLVELIEEFRRRQRRRPDMVVRPWWSPGPAGHGRIRLGFVLEYCPGGRESAELQVRGRRVTVDAPGGVTEARLDLEEGWILDGVDLGCPETLANHLVRLADHLLGEAA